MRATVAAVGYAAANSEAEEEEEEEVVLRVLEGGEREVSLFGEDAGGVLRGEGGVRSGGDGDLIGELERVEGESADDRVVGIEERRDAARRAGCGADVEAAEVAAAAAVAVAPLTFALAFG